MLDNNTIESSRKPGIPGPHRPDLKWFKDALDGKSDVGHIHKKKDIEDFEHNHDGRYYRKDEHELQLLLSGNGTPNFNQGINGDYYVDELNGDLYKKSGDAWNLIIHLEGEQGIPGPQGNPGIRGPEGPTGKEGYTPVRGTDYWTPEDEEIIRQSIVSEVQLGLSGKVDKVEGKGLSTEDFTTLLKQKLEELQNYDDRDIRELLEKALYNVTIDVKTGILTFHTIDESSFTVDLPLELIVSDGYLDNDTNTIVLVLANGNTIDIPVENLIRDFYSKTEIDQKISNLTNTVNADIKNINDELDEAKLEFDSRISANEQAIQNDKSEFESETVQGNSLYFDDAAERPLGLIPYGEPVQTVIEEEVGVTVEGESVVVTDGNPEKEVKDVIYGMSKQKTTEGYNELPYPYSDTVVSLNGLTISSNNNGTLLLNGTSTGTVNFYFKRSSDSWELEKGKYTFSINNNHNKITRIVGGNTSNIAYTYSTQDNMEFEVVNGGSVENPVVIQIGSGVTFNNTILEPMIRKTTVTDTTYEPYTGGQASPNTEYKQDIEVIDGVNRFPLSVNSPQKVRCTVSLEEDNFIFNATGTDMYFGNVIGTGNAYTTFMGELIDVSLKERVYLKVTNAEINTNFVNFYDKNKISLGYYRIQDFVEIPQNAKYCTFRIGKNASVAGETYIAKIMVSFDDLPYLPYGHIGLVQRGKNLINDEQYKGKNIVTSFFSNINENKFIPTEHQFKKDKFYKFNVLFTDGTMVEKTDWNLAIAFYDINKTQLTSIPVYGAYDIASKSLDGVKYIKVITNSTGETTYGSKTIQAITLVELDDSSNAITLEDFEPYIEPIVHEIDLDGEKLAKVGEIADLLNIGVDGRVSIKNLIKHRILNGSENWNMANNNSVNTNRFVLDDRVEGLNSGVIHAISNKLIGKTANDLWLNDIEGIGHSVSQLIMRLNTSTGVTNASTLKTWLSENNIECYSVGSEETITLPSIEPITLIEGITNVFELVTNLGTTMALTYDYVTPSPSIDRPSEIFTVQGSYRTEKVNENFLPLNYENNSITTNGVTVTFDKSTGIFKVTGKATTDTWFNIYPIFKAGTNENDAGEPINALNKYLVTNTKKWGMNDSVILTLGATLSDTTANYKQITRETVKRGFLYFPKTDKEINTEFWLMICDDYNQDTYIQHQSTTLPLTVGNELLGEIVTLSEEEAKQLNLDGAGKYRRTDYGRYVFAGYEWFLKNPTQTGHRFYNTDIIKDATHPASNTSVWEAYSNMFVIGTPENTYFSVECISYDANNTALYICCERFKTVDEFQAILKSLYNAGTPMEIIYKLATPTYEKITDETELAQLSAYDKQIAFFGINNINTYPTDDLVKAPLGLKVTYDKSNRIIIQRQAETIENQDKRITALEATVNTLLGGN